MVCFIASFLSEVKHVIDLVSRLFDLSLCNFLVIFELHLKVGKLVLHLLLDVLLGLTFRHQGALLLLNRLNFCSKLDHILDPELLCLGHVLVDLLTKLLAHEVGQGDARALHVGVLVYLIRLAIAVVIRVLFLFFLGFLALNLFLFSFFAEVLSFLH